jgi:CRISPR-associated protein Cmr6
MKKGKLIIKKKGAHKYISEFHEEGSDKIMPLSFYQPDDDSLNGKLCTWDSKGGRHELRLIEEDEIIYPKNENKMEDSYKSFMSQLPGFTTRWLGHETNTSKIDNFHLKLNKAARLDNDNQDSKFKFHSTEDKPGDGKKPFSIKVLFGKFNKDVISEKGFSKRTKTFASNLGMYIKSFEAKSSQGFPRLVIGLGNESVYENGMTLHHIYGIPYIPGSAAKGITRNWIITECFGTHKGVEQEAENDPVFNYIFGTGGDGEEGGNKGHIYFFDAFPTAVPTIEPDIMNNHYQSYYDGDDPPADWLSPNPVFFLTVKDGKFCFQLAVKKNMTIGDICRDANKEQTEKGKEIFRRISKKETTPVLEIVEAWLRSALQHHGIGAKTAVGYGRMK